MAKLFGFTIGRDDKQNVNPEESPSFVAKDVNDGAIEVASGGIYGTYVDLEGKAKNEVELITKYREMALQPECDSAIQDICNEAVVTDSDQEVLKIALDRTGLSAGLKRRVREEFLIIQQKMNFQSESYELFRRWFTDGRVYFHVQMDKDNPKKGITGLRYVDPRKIRKVKHPIKKKEKDTGVTLHYGANEYYIYNDKGLGKQQNQGVKIATDSVIFNHSGLVDSVNHMVYGHLHKAIKPLNQLRMLEDAVVIYRLARAPERRIFYIDVGNLPKMKAEQYLNDMMIKHKNKLVYDAATGEVRDDRKFMTMLEDFWLPRREGGRGTEISTLPGGQNLGEMDDVDYFRKKLYKSLNVPSSRLESENTFNLGRASEITRDELKFTKFIHRLRTRFSNVFNDALELQLSLKGIMSRKEFQDIKGFIGYEWTQDNYFTELKESELINARVETLERVDAHLGKFYSKHWVQKHVLRMDESEITQMEKEIEDEGGEDEYDDEEEQTNHDTETLDNVVDLDQPAIINNKN